MVLTVMAMYQGGKVYIIWRWSKHGGIFYHRTLTCLTRNIEEKQLNRTYKQASGIYQNIYKSCKRLQDKSKYSSGLKTKRGKRH